MSNKNRSAFSSLFWVGLVVLALVGATSAGAQKDAPPISGEFPPNPEIEYERSVIRFPIALCGPDGLCETCMKHYDCPGGPSSTSSSSGLSAVDESRIEMVELTAYMKLVRDYPLRNSLGYRQFEFLIEEWELFGYSELLGGWLSFSASDVVQPNSLALSLQKTSDYPALIVYSAIYDIFLDDVKLVSNRAGTAMGRGVVEIPPRNVTVAFSKPQEITLAGESIPTMEFCCGSCEDMQTITREEFEAGLAEARAVRMASTSNSDPTARAALIGGSSPATAPADPEPATGAEDQR